MLNMESEFELEMLKRSDDPHDKLLGNVSQLITTTHEIFNSTLSYKEIIFRPNEVLLDGKVMIERVDDL
jgi:hypothetical protein